MKRYAGATTDDLWQIARGHGVVGMRVFGSWARGEGGPGSDLDLLVRLEPGRTLWDLSRLKEELEALVGTRVDVVTEGGLSSSIRERVLREAIAL